MPPRDQRPIRGKYNEILVSKQTGKMSDSEIARKLGVTEGAIRYLLKRMTEGRERMGRGDHPSFTYCDEESRPQGESNPRYRIENPGSWAAGRWGRNKLQFSTEDK